jgi:hypothetical protein
MFPIGGGIPLGVLMARNGGVPLAVIPLLYLISDVFLACTTEPFLLLLRWLGRRIPPLGRLGARLSLLSSRVGLRDAGARGPLGLILVSFTISPTTGRAAAAAAGHGFLSGWSLAILGDMGYFMLLMLSTLWLSDVLGNDRLVIGIMLAMTWVLPLLLRRLRPGPASPSTREQPVLVPASLPRQVPDVATRARRRGKRR